MTDPVVKRQFIDGRHGQLHLRVAGHMSSKRPIVCLHMMPKSGRIFKSLMPELAKSRFVIAPDYVAYGESGCLPDDVQPSIDVYADSIVDVINHFCLTKVDLLGYHTGSLVAANLAYRFPEKVGKIIKISAPILSEDEIRDFNKYYAPIPLDEAGTRYKLMWERVMYYRGPGMTLELAAESFAENLRAGERYEDGHAAAFDYATDYIDHLQSIHHSIFVMNFGDDLFEHTKRVDKYLKNGKRIDYPEWGHGALSLWPGQVAKPILNFLDQE